MVSWSQEIVLAVVSGLATTISAFALLWLFNTYRNWRLKNKIKKSIEEKSSQLALKGLDLKYIFAGVVIYNPFDFPFTIRSVWAESGEKGHSSRSAMKYAGSYHQDDMIPMGTVKKNPYGVILLEPFTNGQWVIEAKELSNRSEPINRVRVHVEFLTFFRTPKVVEVNITTPHVLKFINEMIEENALVEGQ